jgi:3D (Asp-Asp-Asp) domain-containing protein
MIFSKFHSLWGYFTFFLILFISYICVFFDKRIEVLNNSFTKTSNLSVVRIPFETEVIYSDELIYGSSNVIVEGVDGYALEESGNVISRPINKIVQIGRGPLSIFYGSTTGYGADCFGCSGNVSCNTSNGVHNLIRDGIYYNDPKYGDLRIVAADNSVFSCGTVLKIDNGIIDPFFAIVLDTGGAMRSAWSNGNILVDIAYPYEYSNGINSATNRSGSVKFMVYRNGW